MSTLNNKVVYAALTRMTNDREVIKHAFLNWHSKFADDEIDVFAYVDHIERFLGLNTGEKKILMVSMHAAASKGEGDLGEVPAYIFGSDATADVAEESVVKSEDKTPCIVLAQLFCNRMASGVQRLGNKHRQELNEILKDEGLPSATLVINEVLKKIGEEDIVLPSSTSEADCKTLCHEFYMLVCDVVGPNSADELSYKTISTLLDTNEASRFDPRDLI